MAVLAVPCCGVTWPLSPQPPELEQLGRVVELDSDMADITQEPAQEALAEDLAEEQEAVPASTHIASTQGINPYVLQVSVCCPPLSWRGLGKGGSTSQGCISLPEGVYTPGCNDQCSPGSDIELTHHISVLGKAQCWHGTPERQSSALRTVVC